ncbi:hypothetical protein [Klenkia brasiliensis]|uniref:EVE domain-containing protein n=1 Tax=Klenkia brasiliensis TaxID=333142 RepID=A0A1G7VQF5_9ACTN|nr:hypothetical protein [Klenkia brasiliensis]SDG61811.1 hypothetical protein SAMN05660324_3163 [Klenkia brasiliensis]
MLTRAGIGCWVLTSAALPERMLPGWDPGHVAHLTRCVRRSYRLDLVEPGDPVLLWCSGRVDPGVHAVGTVTGLDPGALEVGVRWTRLADPVPRGALLADPVARTAEVLRMPAGSNPSWLSPAQWAAVQDLSPTAART